MIKALRDLGEELQEENKGKNLILKNILDIDSLKRIDNLLEILIENFEYKGVEYSQLSVSDNIDKAISILYKGGSGNSANFTPTTRLNYNKEYEYQKFYKKFIQYFKSFEDNFKDIEVKKEEQELINKLKDTIKANKEQILKDIETALEKYDAVSKKNKDCIITLKIDAKNLKDFPFFTNSIMNTFFKKASTSSNKKSVGKDKTCCLSHQKSDNVYGNANNFTFMTWDKWSYISGGFDEKQVWKNYPVSPDSYMLVELGKREIERKMSFYFCGFRYYLIPKLVLEKSIEKEQSNISLTGIIRKFSSSSEADQNIYNINKMNKLVKKEDRVFRNISEINNNIIFNFMFYETINSAFRILLNIEDVPPTIIKKLYKAKKNIQNYSLFNRIDKLELPYGKDNIYKADFTFNILRENFFYNKKQKGNFDKTFLELVGKIFTQRPVDYYLLIDRFVKELQYLFRNDYGLLITVSNAFLTLFFLNELQILNRRKGEYMKYYNDNEAEKEFEKFFEEHKEFYDKPEKIAAFLVGIYTQKLLNIQYTDKGGNRPFINRLNGLKIREDILKRIFTETKNKLLEYGKTYYTKLEALIGKYFSDCGDFSGIKNDELSFYFATGMSLAKLFLKSESKEKEENLNI
ncbi:MAG: TIGR02556 family CRISPR-associated protein [Spirochaetota bacterium]